MIEAARFLRQLSESSGYSLRELSRRAGFTETMAERIVDGTLTNPSIFLLQKFADAVDHEVIILPRRTHSNERCQSQ